MTPPPPPFQAPRPSARELIGKVRVARDAITAGRCQIALNKHWLADLQYLPVASKDELWPLVSTCLDEILEAGPEKDGVYVGGRPPQRSYEPELKGLELWAYAWDSPTLGQRFYLKFALKKAANTDNWHYLHIDLHPDRPDKRRRP